MKRLHQFMLIGSFVPLCWYGMMAVHELGHVTAAAVTGGTVTKVVLDPLAISRTDVAPNPMPLIVVWAGPLVGVILPLLVWMMFRFPHIPGAYLPRFFAGVCLIANGAYIGIGSLDRVGDAGTMLRHGAPMGLLWLFGAATMPTGFWLWHRLGPHFGLGQARGHVDPVAAYVSVTLFVLVLTIAAAFGR